MNVTRSTPAATLRRATADVHRAVEQQVETWLHGIDRRRYAALLTRIARVHRGTDRVLSSWFASDTHLGIERRRKVPKLRADLAALGSGLPEAVVIETSTASSAYGVLYVCEGATLGGALIAPRLRSVLGPDAPVAHFHAYGADTPRMWASCRAALDTVPDDEVDVAVDAARRTFGLFADALAR
jgi:heme oxygenase